MNERNTYLPDIHRLLPQDAEAERSLLCSFLLDARFVGGVCAEKNVTAEHFHLPTHAMIYGVLMDLWDKGSAIDFVILTGVLRDQGRLDQVGGAGYVTELGTLLPTAANADYYIGILAAKFTLRRIIKVCTEYAARSYDEQHDHEGLLNDVETAILAIRKSDDSELREQEPKALVLEVVRNIEDHYERKGQISGLTTGFKILDDMTDGLHGGDMFVIAARPSMGKTALAMTIAEHIALEVKKTVAVFTLEMSDKALMQRALLSRARVNLHSMRMGFLAERDFPAMTAVASKFADGKLRIIDAVGATIGAIKAKARRIARRHPDLAAIFIDYIQKARSNSRQAQGSREREIAEISSGLKDIAKELNLPIVVLAQLNRDVEKRKGSGRPQLSDLRESGAIEQDADVVGLLWREEHYATDEEEKRRLEGMATLIIAKSRNGPVGDVPLTFLKEFARYENRAQEYQGEPDLREDPYAGKRKP